MPLQLRRGSTADRLAATPLVGEIVYDTTTRAVYVGDGVTPGGAPVTNFSVADARSTTAKMFLGDSLSDNSQHSGITFALIGNRLNATVQQDLSNYLGLIVADQGFKGSLWADDSGMIVNAETHTIYGNFVPQGHIVPETNIAYDLGTPTKRFRDLWLSGSSIHLGDAVITSIDNTVNLPVGSTIAGQQLGINEGDTYSITVAGNLIGVDSTILVNSTTGTFHGDLTGSVFADDSSILVDASDGVLRGTLIGNLTGNVTGDVTGNAASATVSSSVALTSTDTSTNPHYLGFVAATTGNQPVRTDTNLSYVPTTNSLTAGTFVGNLTGNVSGNLTGNVTGNADTATAASSVALTATDTSTDPHYIGFVAAATGNQAVRTDTSLSYVPTTNSLTAGTFIGSLTGNVLGNVSGNVTGNVTGNADTATAASSVTLVPTNTSAGVHYISFTANPTGNESVRSDTSLTYQPSTNTLALSAINATSVTSTNLFASIIDTADSSAISVVPAITFNSDVTIENELFAGGHILPVNSESYDLGSYTKKFNKLYLTEGANAFWIGNAAISGSGTTINLPAGSTVGGSAITTAAGANATTITVNTTGTSADHFVSFFDDQTGDNLIYTDDTFKYNPGTGILTVGDAIIGSVTGNLIGNVTGNVSGNAGTVTNGVYTSGDQTINGSKTFSSSILGNLTGDVTGNLTGGVTSTSVAVGSNTVAGSLLVRSPTNGSVLAQLVIAHNTAASTSSFAFNRSRGTPSAPTAVNSGDRLGDMRFNGHNGTSYVNSVFVRAEAAGVSGSNVAGRFRVLTTDTSGNVNVGLTVDGVADVYVSNNLYVTKTATIGGILIDNNKISNHETNADIELGPNGTGTVDFQVVSQSTVGPSGVASALPANPSTYFKIKVNGVEYVVPAYAVA